MKVILIILGIFVYLLIGGVVSGLMDTEEDSDVSCKTVIVFFWPLAVALLIIVGIGIGMTKLGVFIAEYLVEILTSMGEQIESWFGKKEEEE